MRSCFYAAGIAQISILTVLIIGLSACSSNASSAIPSPTPTPAPSPTPVPTPTPTPTPVPSAHLYVATRSNTTAQIQQFTLPITSSSTPSVTLSTFGAAMAVDSSGNLAVFDGLDNVDIYMAPLSNSSVPSVTFPGPSASAGGGMGFDAQGNLYVSGIVGSNTEVDIFKPPFSSGTTPAQTVSISGTVEAVDLIGNLYFDISGVQCSIEVLAPPYNGMPATIFSETCNGEFSFSLMAATSTQLFVALDNFPGFPGGVDVFDLSSNPIGAGLFGITTSGPQQQNEPFQTAVDSNGNLYVVVRNTAAGPNTNLPVILVFAAPLSNSSTPAATLILSNNPSNNEFITASAVGP